MSYSSVKSLGLLGLNAFMVDVELDLSRGTPTFEIVGLADISVRESRERIRSAISSIGFSIPPARIVINMAPADLKKVGTMHDLAIFVALLDGMGRINCDLKNACFLGELALNGMIRPINGILPMVLLAREKGIKYIYVPKENAVEASSAIDEDNPNDIKIYGVESVAILVKHLNGVEKIVPTPKYKPKNQVFDGLADFADVKGQHNAKKALEIAAAGGHNALMIGSPGSGKSMLAKRIPSILPPMTYEESIETTKIYSICGMLDSKNPFIINRPFRSPHHTISSAGLIGGGSIPRPGEVSLAHNGVLFLDELAEFDKHSIEVLRQPLEDGKVTITRAAGTITYPCNIMLIGAMNPCPCGYFGHPKRQCTCSKNQVKNYLAKISGPLLDRFDLHIEVAPVEFSDLSSERKEESSEKIRKRVVRAREIQNERFKGTGIKNNALIPANKLSEYCPMDDAANRLLELVFNTLGLSARAYDRILKVARTLADIDESDIIKKTHVATAAQYRSLDRKYWAN